MVGVPSSCGGFAIGTRVQQRRTRNVSECLYSLYAWLSLLNTLTSQTGNITSWLDSEKGRSGIIAERQPPRSTVRSKKRRCETTNVRRLPVAPEFVSVISKQICVAYTRIDSHGTSERAERSTDHSLSATATTTGGEEQPTDRRLFAAARSLTVD